MNLEVITREVESQRRQTDILFVHGAWHAAWCWEEHFLSYFARQCFRSYAVSLRSHGNSEGSDRLRPNSLDDYVADVAQIAGQMDSPPVVVGHSLGGIIVEKYLGEFKSPAAVVMASAHTGLVSTLLRIASRHPLALLKSALVMRGKKALAKGELFSKDMAPERQASYFARLQDEPLLVGFELPKPERVKTPLLFLGARNDTIIHTNQIKATAHDYQTEAEIFPNMAHDMMLEDSWKSVADRILAWLREQRL